MDVLFMNVDWVTTLVAAVVSFLVGWVWYSPILFQEKWLEGVGVAADDNSSMLHAMIAQVLSTFLLAWVIGLVMAAHSLELAVLVGLTLAVTIKANGLFVQKSRYAIMVESGFILAMTAIMIAVHSLM